MNKKILILTGGPKKKLDLFSDLIKKSGLNVTLSSFYDLKFLSTKKNGTKLSIMVGDTDLKEFALIYFRVIGKRMEEASLVVNYAKENGIQLVDGLYQDSLFIPSTISKAMEMKKLIDAGIPMPKTLFAGLKALKDLAPKEFGFPFVLKSTSGRKARDAWIISDRIKMNELFDSLHEREKTGVHFFAQTPIKATQRIRVLVVGGEIIGAITRPTKWRKTLIGNGEEVEGKKEGIINLGKKYCDLALEATKAVNLDISGVDILEEDETGSLYIIEVNAAPAWKLITKDCGVNVEEKVLNFLATKI